MALLSKADFDALRDPLQWNWSPRVVPMYHALIPRLTRVRERKARMLQRRNWKPAC